MVTLDNMATRYHCLPSEVLDRATTFDLAVMDSSIRWHQFQEEVARDPAARYKPGRTAKYNTETLRAMLDSVRKRE